MSIRDAVIVSTARTPIGRAYKGAFNATPSPTLAAHAIRAAVERAGIDPAEIDDVIIGAALQQGVQATIGRTAALRAGLPVTVAGMSHRPPVRVGPDGHRHRRQAGHRRPHGRVRRRRGRKHLDGPDPRDAARPRHGAARDAPDVYMPMIDTAEIVAKRYGISREACDDYALQSQQRTAAAQAEGRFAAEIIPVTAKMGVKDKETGAISMHDVTLDKDEGNRPDTTLEGLAALQPVRGEGTIITAGNASQLTDGASACVVMDAALAAKRGLEPLGRYVGMAVAGTEPDEMGIGPVFAVPKLLERFGLKIERHRPVGTERGVRGAGALLPRHARHPRRTAQRRRRRDLDRPPLRHDRRAPDRPRPDRRQAPRRQICRRHDVRRRRHGRGGPVRGALIATRRTDP